MSTRTFHLPFEVDLPRTISPLRTGRHDPTILVDRTTLLQAMRTPDGPATLRIDLKRGDATAEAWGAGAAWALDHAPGVIGALDDPEPIVPHHPIVARLQRRFPGLRLPQTNRVIEAVIPAVLSQKVTDFEASRSFRLLVESWGEPAPGPGGVTLLPTVEQITALGYHDLHVIGMERKRADTLHRVAARAGRLEAAGLTSSAELRHQLEQITGVGQWISAEVARAALGEADAVSVGDLHLKNTVAWALAEEPRGSDARMLELLRPYAGHRGRVCRLLEAGAVRAPRYEPRQRIEPIAGR
jgi:3-methyladenine DNA glycosylase/8-oxoguanine DNA glycosylase